MYVRDASHYVEAQYEVLGKAVIFASYLKGADGPTPILHTS